MRCQIKHVENEENWYFLWFYHRHHRVCGPPDSGKAGSIPYEALILGTSTWGDGELQDDWYDGIKVLKNANLSAKIIALFGCGDSESYSDTFCDGMGILFEDLKDSGCTFVGAVPDSDYTYASSVAAAGGKFVGLALDDVNESDRTDARVSAWTEMLKADLA